MKVVLLKQVKKLGKENDVVTVADGYALNYLFPQKLAKPATVEVLKDLEEKKKETKEKEAKQRELFQKLAQKIDGRSFVIKKAGEKNKLFGSVSAKEIAEQIGDEISEENIKIKKAIKEEGEYNIVVSFSKDIFANIKLIVEIDGKKDK